MNNNLHISVLNFSTPKIKLRKNGSMPVNKQYNDTVVKKNVSFKAVSINKSAMQKLVTESGLNKEISEIYNLLASGAFKSLEELETAFATITKNMSLKRAEIEARPWYKSFRNASRHRKVDKEEINAKTGIITLKQTVVEEAKQQADKIQELSKNAAKLAEDNSGEKMIKRQRLNGASNDIRGEFKQLKGFSKIAGYEEEQDILKTYFINEIKKEKMGLPADVPGSVLFFGPTGNGKSTFARAFANETGCNFVVVKKPISSPELTLEATKKKFMKNLIKIAKEAEKKFAETNIRTVIFMDEITKVADKNSPILRQLNAFLNNCSKKYHCTLFAATNYPSGIALKMDGARAVFPYRVALEPPHLQNKAEVLKFYAKDLAEENIDYAALAKEMEEVEHATGQAFSISQIRQMIGYGNLNKTLTQSDISEIIRRQTPAIDKEHLSKFNDEIKEFIQNKVEIK